MALARGRRERGIDYWPGFVDALSTLVLGIIFLLTVFVVVQFFLSQEVAGKDTALTRLNAQIAELTDLLSLEKTGKVDLEDEIARLRARPRRRRERARPPARQHRRRIEHRRRAGAAQRGPGQDQRALGPTRQREERRPPARSPRSRCSTSRSRRCAGSSRALEDGARRLREEGQGAQAQIADLGQRLNVALAQRVQELSRYRSDFFGRLREILGNRPDIRVVGDRFVLPVRSAVRHRRRPMLSPEGRAELDKLAGALLELDKQDSVRHPLGAAGRRPYRRAPDRRLAVPSNWELSAARAISVVQYLISKGISPQRLVAAGFGEFQPLDPGNTEEASAATAGIELKLTER